MFRVRNDQFPLSQLPAKQGPRRSVVKLVHAITSIAPSNTVKAIWLLASALLKPLESSATRKIERIKMVIVAVAIAITYQHCIILTKERMGRLRRKGEEELGLTNKESFPFRPPSQRNQLPSSHSTFSGGFLILFKKFAHSAMNTAKLAICMPKPAIMILTPISVVAFGAVAVTVPPAACNTSDTKSQDVKMTE